MSTLHKSLEGTPFKSGFEVGRLEYGHYKAVNCTVTAIDQVLGVVEVSNSRRATHHRFRKATGRWEQVLFNGATGRWAFANSDCFIVW